MWFMAVHEPAVEVRVKAHTRVTLATYTAILDEVRRALDDVDRFALPGRAPRLSWAIRDMEGGTDLRIVLAPLRVPKGRSEDTLGWSSRGLVAGINQLEHKPAIPELFSARTVQRVSRVGQQMSRGNLHAVELASLNGRRHDATINTKTLESARKAVKPVSQAWGSVTGQLEELVARSGKDPRAVVYMERARRAVVVRASIDQADMLRQAWGQRVLVGGPLTRNSEGQPLRIDLTELEALTSLTSVPRAWDLVGIAPNATGELSTDEYIERLRRG